MPMAWSASTVSTRQSRFRFVTTVLVITRMGVFKKFSNTADGLLVGFGGPCHGLMSPLIGPVHAHQCMSHSSFATAVANAGEENLRPFVTTATVE